MFESKHKKNMNVTEETLNGQNDGQKLMSTVHKYYTLILCIVYGVYNIELPIIYIVG